MEEKKIVHRRHRILHDRTSSTSSLKDAMQAWLKQAQLNDRYQQERIKVQWAEIMGATIGQRTELLYFKGSVLYVKLNSAPLKNEMRLSKHLVIERINAVAGVKLIVDAVFL